MLTEIFTDRFILRPLNINDVSESYAGWLSDNKTSQYIKTKINLTDLRLYVAERSGREDALFLGIFVKNTKFHIGNIKFEPVDSKWVMQLWASLLAKVTCVEKVLLKR